MGIFAKLNPWAGAPSDVLLVDDSGSPLSKRICDHLAGTGVTCSISSDAKRSKAKVVHFLQFPTAQRTFPKNPLHSAQLAISVSGHHVLDSTDVVSNDCEPPTLIADCNATATAIQHTLPLARTTVIYEGIHADDFAPTRINGRLTARRELNIPSDALCVGIFERLSDSDEEVAAEALAQIAAQIGPTALLSPSSTAGSTESLAAKLRHSQVSVIDFAPRRLEDLQTCFAALDVYLNLSQTGDLRGILRSWATGVPIASTPNPMARDLLKDGLTAAVSEDDTGESLARAATELHQNEEFRHGCCQRGRVSVQQFTWQQILPQYEALYAQLLANTRQAA